MALEVGIMLRGQYPFGADMVKMAQELVEQACLADRLGGPKTIPIQCIGNTFGRDAIFVKHCLVFLDAVSRDSRQVDT